MLWSKFQFSIHIFGGILRTRVAQGTVQSPKQSFRCHGSSDSSRTPPRLAPCVLAMSSIAFVGPQATVATPQAGQLVIRVISCEPMYNCTTCFRDFRDHSYTTNISNAKGSWPMQGFGAALGGVAGYILRRFWECSDMKVPSKVQCDSKKIQYKVRGSYNFLGYKECSV